MSAADVNVPSDTRGNVHGNARGNVRGCPRQRSRLSATMSTAMSVAMPVRKSTENIYRQLPVAMSASILTLTLIITLTQRK